jgi:hypothetical protein
MSLGAQFCTMLGLTSGWCAQFNPPTPPAFPAPSGPLTLTQMTVPGAYTPEDSELATQAATVAQSQQFLQNVVMPGVTAPCDWTAAVLTDVTTWCAGNWAIVAVGIVAVALATMPTKGGRH